MMMPPCEFLDKLSFSSLIDPIGNERFRRAYLEKKPLVIHRGNPAYYKGLFTLDDIDDTIARNPEYVKLANAKTKKNASYRSEMTPGIEAVLSDMRDGGTLVLDQLQRHDPKLGLLCRVLAAEVGHRFHANLYLTPPNGRGFTPHWDNHDVFVLQLVGSKHWKVETQRRKIPARGEQMGEEGRELVGELLSFRLDQGDAIYIPRGFVHAAECASEPSLHTTLGVSAYEYEDVLRTVITAAVQRDASLRAVLPLGFMHGLYSAEITNRARQAFVQAADDAFLREVFDQYRDELVKAFTLDISGQVEEFFQSTPLGLEDRVGPRRGAVYRVHRGEDSVRLNLGSRSVTFPGLFRKAVDYALATPAFHIRELPGEIDNEERIVFIERLIQEGLVVRK